MFSWADPTATDNCGVASLTGSHTSGASFLQGSTTVTYTATDVSGNVSPASFTLTVTENGGFEGRRDDDELVPEVACDVFEVGADGDANFVATAINEYRNTFQPYDESSGEEGVETNTASTVDLGQPKRQLPSEEEEELSMEDQIYDTVGMAGAGGLGAFDQGMGMEELETNYFTNIQQIELVDGTDGSEEDILTSQRGIDRVSEEDDSVLQKVLNDYRPVMVFGSTYFTIVLKGKAKTSPLVKTGVLIVKRDPREQMMEVVFWKELQN